MLGDEQVSAVAVSKHVPRDPQLLLASLHWTMIHSLTKCMSTSRLSRSPSHFLRMVMPFQAVRIKPERKTAQPCLLGMRYVKKNK